MTTIAIKTLNDNSVPLVDLTARLNCSMPTAAVLCQFFTEVVTFVICLSISICSQFFVAFHVLLSRNHSFSLRLLILQAA